MNSSTLPARGAGASWQRLDQRLFLWVGGGHRASRGALRLACLVSRWSWLPLLTLMTVRLASAGAAGLLVLAQCLSVAALVQVSSKRLARRWCKARPFMLGLSPNHLGHSQRAGFPSTHAMVMGAVLGFLSLPLQGDPVLAAMAITLLATGWARVYAGAHFPLDVIAGTLAGGTVGILSAHAMTL